jgi:hypothetical protein
MSRRTLLFVGSALLWSLSILWGESLVFAAGTLYVPYGDTVKIRGTHFYDYVTIEGHLILTGDTTLDVRHDMTIGTSGYVYCEADGKPGADGKSAVVVGAPGERGGNGGYGKDAFDLTLFIGGNLFLKGRITVNGGRGGKGGNGGNGGEGQMAVCCNGGLAAFAGGNGGGGGNGGKGGNGGTLTVFGKGIIFHNSHGSLQANGGLAGTAGQGGLGRSGGGGCVQRCYDPVTDKFLYISSKNNASVGRPGISGQSGKGGAGGKVLVWAKEIEADPGFISLSLTQAMGGMGGHGAKGQHGTGGISGMGLYDDEGDFHCISNMSAKSGYRGSRGGDGGAGGEIYINTCTLNRINGLQAGGGYGGNGGDSPYQGGHVGGGEPDCAIWRQGFDGLNGPQGGLGGLGGRIRLETYTLGPYVLNAPGGEGGDGGNGGNGGITNCMPAGDCTATNGQPADGGNGGPGNHGGNVSLKYASYKELLDLDPSVDISPGQGGIGGDYGSSQIPWGNKVFGTPGLDGQAGQTGIFNKLRLVDNTLLLKLASNTNLVQTGENFTYIFGVSSPKLEQYNLHLTLDLPDQFTIVKVKSTPSAKWTIDNDRLVWDIPKIKACQTFNFTVVLQVKETAGPTTINNRLSATTDQISETILSNLVRVKILAPAGP